jgi:streptomycin 3"-adenylyltransferase
MELQYGEWLREDFARGVIPAPGPNPDLPVLLTEVLRTARPLFGPTPDVLIDPVPDEDLCRAMVDCVPTLLAEVDTDTTNVLLTLARIWFTLTTGTISPKNVAAEWAAARLPAGLRSPLAKACAIYVGDAPDDWAHDLARAEAGAQQLVEEIKRCGSG